MGVEPLTIRIFARFMAMLSNLDRRSLEENNEVGPFYGHALPSEFLVVGVVAAPSVRSTVTLFRRRRLNRVTDHRRTQEPLSNQEQH